jgi:hypothetical protein
MEPNAWNCTRSLILACVATIGNLTRRGLHDQSMTMADAARDAVSGQDVAERVLRSVRLRSAGTTPAGAL